MDLRKKGFQLPEKVYFDEESLADTYGKLYAETFERGFGTTIGNSLRRVLLSSIEGAAITSIRIPGVFHEFSTVPGVKEDLVDIILNVKQLRLSLHSDTPKVVTIKVKGPCEVTGKDIITVPQVEVLTPDVHIATVEKNVEFKMELTVKKGKGYNSAEKNKEEGQALDVIAIDSVFSPVKRVNFWVEKARVGRETDYDKLIMEIWTDGSITPEWAVTQAAHILNEHISLFFLEEEPADEYREDMSYAGMNINPDENSQPIFNDNLLKSVDELELSVRASNCLKNADIRSIADLVQRTEQEMLRTKNFGRKSLNEIKEVLISMGLHFNMRVDTEALNKALANKGGESAA
ncbi:MAG: DNA-directed RNA polymerase subunit alpha [Nitrospirae bacterium]|nr:DNA-directed RNA polymerase subunit alpha [Nitrospirota bacterium]